VASPSTVLAEPKSPIFATPSLVKGTFDGLKSRWIMPFEWRKKRPLIIEMIALFINVGLNPFRSMSPDNDPPVMFSIVIAMESPAKVGRNKSNPSSRDGCFRG
jgi:hypothetical protein